MYISRQNNLDIHCLLAKGLAEVYRLFQSIVIEILFGRTVRLSELNQVQKCYSVTVFGVYLLCLTSIWSH